MSTISISQLRNLVQQTHEDAGRDALYEIRNASTALLDVVDASIKWQRAVRERCDYGSATYANSPFDITSPEFRAEAARLDAVADGLLSKFLLALSKVRP